MLSILIVILGISVDILGISKICDFCVVLKLRRKKSRHHRNEGDSKYVSIPLKSTFIHFLLIINMVRQKRP